MKQFYLIYLLLCCGIIFFDKAAASEIIYIKNQLQDQNASFISGKNINGNNISRSGLGKRGYAIFRFSEKSHFVGLLHSLGKQYTEREWQKYGGKRIKLNKNLYILENIKLRNTTLSLDGDCIILGGDIGSNSNIIVTGIKYNELNIDTLKRINRAYKQQRVCAFCGSKEAKKYCGGCKQNKTFYCSKKHQKHHWKHSHKHKCESSTI